MSNRLHVGNLSYQITEQDLSQMFAEIGAVTSAQVTSDRATGRSRGFGFVEMESADAAQQAITALNGREVGGRALAVSEARPRPAAS
jgi:cold-inducible RNA-binding protein